jgi:hypothetical protein
VNAEAASIYLLNAADGHLSAGAMLTFNYADQSNFTEDVVVHSWAFPSDSRYAKAGPRTEDTYRVAWKKVTSEDQEAGVYVTGINNPHPDRRIASIELTAAGTKGRWLILAVTLSTAKTFFAPYDDLSTGIPDGWNGSVLYALFEGLAGIKDLGAAFSRTAIVPRWISAKVPLAEITLRYPSSAGYASYRYIENETTLVLEFTGNAERFDLEILLPPGRKAGKTRLNGLEVHTTERRIEESSYLVLPAIGGGVHRLELDLA